MKNLARKIYHACVPHDLRASIRESLLGNKPHAAPVDSLIRVSFMGPWNYSLGLGIASKGYLAALMQANVSLNAYAIAKPLHKHKRSTAMLSMHSFDGPSDVCLINLSPDLWPGAFTSKDHQIIKDAAVRIALWVWETPILPQEWKVALPQLNAVWAPSQFCADIFEKTTGLPVDVVPYFVPLPDLGRVPSSRKALHAHCHLPDAAKVILYVFDSMNILSRKNPYALVRAFKASGLSQRGWVLILKTKNLFEHPESGNLLVSDIDHDPAIILLNDNMTPVELSQLFFGCDIYASPHSSEGFGLTVAEAMAAQKLVVATDYSSTAEFLDSETGYPVAFEQTAIGTDSLLYDGQATWAKIDENDLSAKLQEAAFDVEAGRFERGIRARQRIGQRFSAEHVAECMEKCLARWRS